MVTAMNKRLITPLAFVLAAVLYFIGFAFTATISLVLGVIAEMVFGCVSSGGINRRQRTN